MKIFVRLLKYAGNIGFRAPIFLLCIVFHMIFRVINIVAILPVLQLLFNQNPNDNTPTTKYEAGFSLDAIYQFFYAYLNEIITQSGPIKALVFLAVLLILSVIVSNFFLMLSMLSLEKVRIDLITNLRKNTIAKMTSFSPLQFNELKKGDLISRFTNDIQQIEHVLINALKVWLKEPVIIIGFLIALFQLSPQLTGYSLVIIPLTGLLVGYLSRKLKKQARQSQQSMSNLSVLIDELVGGIRIILSYNLKNYFLKKTESEIQTYAKNQYAMTLKFNLASSLSEIISVVVLAALLVIGGKMILGEHTLLTAAEFIVFLLLFAQLLSPAKSLSGAVSQMSRIHAAGSRVFELLDKESVIQNQKAIKEFTKIPNLISFENVSFQYHDITVLNQISFQVKRPSNIAIVGMSGSGKTTIAGLLSRFFEPTTGQIFIDGVSIDQYSDTSLRDQIAYVSQETLLFHDSILFNIKLGNLNATSQQIIEAAKIAEAHDFIMDLPSGYETIIGDQGVKLSGGQRQRLCIARAILKNAPVLILDEATSQLDIASESKIFSAIKTIRNHHINLLITHRLGSVSFADKILLLQDGKISEQGNHQSLMASKGSYFSMYNLNLSGNHTP